MKKILISCLALVLSYHVSHAQQNTTFVDEIGQNAKISNKEEQVAVTIQKALELTDSNFQSLVLEKEGVVVVDFWAEWCGPCRFMTPIIKELANEYNGRATIGKMDVDFNPEITKSYNIRNIPTMLIFKNGELVDKHIGVISKQALSDKIDAQL